MKFFCFLVLRIKRDRVYCNYDALTFHFTIFSNHLYTVVNFVIIFIAGLKVYHCFNFIILEDQTHHRAIITSVGPFIHVYFIYNRCSL